VRADNRSESFTSDRRRREAGRRRVGGTTTSGETQRVWEDMVGHTMRDMTTKIRMKRLYAERVDTILSRCQCMYDCRSVVMSF